jgi:hypothetical protein
MKAMRTGGGKGLPPGMELPPGMNLPSGFTASSTRSAAQMPPRKRSKSGNPAKRAAEHG